MLQISQPPQQIKSLTPPKNHGDHLNRPNHQNHDTKASHYTHSSELNHFIARHNALRDALHDTAAAAGLGLPLERKFVRCFQATTEGLQISTSLGGQEAVMMLWTCVSPNPWRTDTGLKLPGNLAMPSPKPIRTR